MPTVLDPTDPLSKMPRQLRWKIRMYRAGRCVTCSKPRTKAAGARRESTYKRLCWKCGELRKIAARLRRQRSL